MEEKGYCIKCKAFYEDKWGAFGECPEGHALLHRTDCQFCDVVLYFQSDDDYCGPDNTGGIICGICAKKQSLAPSCIAPGKDSVEQENVEKPNLHGGVNCPKCEGAGRICAHPNYPFPDDECPMNINCEDCELTKPCPICNEGDE